LREHRLGYPHTLPHSGDTSEIEIVQAAQWFIDRLNVLSTPDFVRFDGSRGCLKWGCRARQNLTHRSRENEFTDGRVLRVKRV
jgi:hypothetical protein